MYGFSEIPEHQTVQQGRPNEEGIVEDDPYLASCLADVTTTNTKKNVSDVTTPLALRDLSELWPSSSSSLYPLDFLPYPDIHKPLTVQADVVPKITSCTADNQPWDLNSSAFTVQPSLLDGIEWPEASNRQLSASHPTLIIEGDCVLNWLPLSNHLSGQYDDSTLSTTQSFTFGLNESPNVQHPEFDVLPIQTENTLVTDACTSHTASSNRQSLFQDTFLNPFSHSQSSPCVIKPIKRSSIQTVFRAHGSKRSKFNEPLKAQTALTRRIGACANCRKKKLRCDQSSKDKFVPCNRCAKAASRLLPGPCCRIELVDVKLFRLGSTASTVTLHQWILAKESRKVTPLLEDGATAVEPPRQPEPNDKTSYVWTDAVGNKEEYALPPYYISDMVEAAKNMRRYAKKARPEFVRALLVDSNPIVRSTFQEAERYYSASRSELIAAALMFWSATRMIERFWLICGADMLGMAPMERNIGPCRHNHHIDAIPVTPIMDTQLDEIAIRDVLIPLKTRLLRILKAKVLAKKKEYWYEICLATFIILHNSERVLDHVVDFARRFGVSPKPKANDESSLSHAYYHACKTLLAYFHFASGGATPLALDWGGPTQDSSIVDQHQVAYLRNIKTEILRQDSQLQCLKDVPMYETELYWCHQMLFPDWKANMPHSGELLEFTEKDFLCS